MATDSVLGLSYLDPGEFIARAVTFGCQAALSALGLDDNSVLPVLAAASREIDALAGRSFTPGQLSENHPFDLKTRRVIVNNPPLITLLSYGIRTSAGLISNFSVTPVVTSGDDNVSFGAIYYNRQENYLELNSLALAGTLTAPFVSLGMTEPQVEIVYTSHASLPIEVVAATGYLAAYRLNQTRANQMLAPGIAAIKDDDVEVRRQSSAERSGGQADVPEIVTNLLRSFTRIAIG